MKTLHLSIILLTAITIFGISNAYSQTPSSHVNGKYAFSPDIQYLMMRSCGKINDLGDVDPQVIQYDRQNNPKVEVSNDNAQELFWTTLYTKFVSQVPEFKSLGGKNETIHILMGGAVAASCPPIQGGNATFHVNGNNLTYKIGFYSDSQVFYYRSISFIHTNQAYPISPLTIGSPLKLDSPLRQFKSGVAANDIICRPDMQLLIENQENFPICVKLNSVSNLLRQDWSYPTNCKYEQDPFTAGVEGLIMIEKNAINSSSGKSYSPRNSTVVIGWNNTVSWINQDVVASSVTSDWNLFDSGPILPGNDWKYNFDCAGNYGYHSEPHPWMKGWIRVLPPSR
jgi:plastocyanin